jgi:phosphoribosylanthranilate isomerase
VLVEIKFCGLTRPADAALGAALGAQYLGVVFAESPRRVDVAGALRVFSELRGGPKRVGVFGAASSAEIGRTAQAVALDVVQMHADPSVADVEAVRALFSGEIWAACRIAGGRLPRGLPGLAAAADRLLLDARSGNGGPMGGTGRQFAWEAVAHTVAELLPHTRLVVAGGLTPANVARAIELFSPSVVDVSSGVECSPGIKDEDLMRAFVRAVGADAT